MEALIAAIERGEAVLLRTDTVFGIAARPRSKGMEDIYALKNRPKDQPLPCFVRFQDIEMYARQISAEAKQLIKAFWPGPLTIILKPNISLQTQGILPSYESIAFRCPNDIFCLDVLKKIDCPLCCTSANVHGQAAPVNKEEIDERFLKLTHGPLDGPLDGELGSSIASTILDCTCRSPKILRKGSISSADIERVLER